MELTEVPSDVHEEMRVLVTFLEPQFIDFQARGIDEVQAAKLRARLATFAEDWDSPEMASYDDYDAAEARSSARRLSSRVMISKQGSRSSLLRSLPVGCFAPIIPTA